MSASKELIELVGGVLDGDRRTVAEGTRLFQKPQAGVGWHTWVRSDPERKTHDGQAVVFVYDGVEQR